MYPLHIVSTFNSFVDAKEPFWHESSLLRRLLASFLISTNTFCLTFPSIWVFASLIKFSILSLIFWGCKLATTLVNFPRTWTILFSTSGWLFPCLCSVWNKDDLNPHCIEILKIQSCTLKSLVIDTKCSFRATLVSLSSSSCLQTLESSSAWTCNSSDCSLTRDLIIYVFNRLYCSSHVVWKSLKKSLFQHCERSELRLHLTKVN